MSKDFGSDNSVAFQDIYSAHDAGALSYLDLYIPTSIYPNKTSVNTIGAWYSKHDPQFLRSDIEIPTGMKDYFKDFKTFVYLYY